MFRVLRSVLEKGGRFTAVEYGIMIGMTLIAVEKMVLKVWVFGLGRVDNVAGGRGMPDGFGGNSGIPHSSNPSLPWSVQSGEN